MGHPERGLKRLVLAFVSGFKGHFAESYERLLEPNWTAGKRPVLNDS